MFITTAGKGVLMDPEGEGPDDDGEIDTDAFVRLLFAGLDAGDQRLVRHGGYILAQMVHSDDQRRDQLINALVAWMIRRPNHDPLLKTLARVKDRYDSSIKQTLLDLADEQIARYLYGQVTETTPWDVNLNDSQENTNIVQIGASTALPIPEDILRRYADNLPGYRATSTAHNRHLKTTSPGRERDWSHWSRLERLQQMPHGNQFAAVETASRYDEFEFLGSEIETRYGHAVQVRTLDGTTEDIAIVRLYKQFDEFEFNQSMLQRFADWDGLQSEGISTLRDWGDTPRPWSIVEFTSGTLWERRPIDPDEIQQIATTLTAALAAAHQHGLVHGGIDPHSVRYTPAVFDETPVPKLDNVGLVGVFRQYDTPASYVDPRYAAPEYFDRQFGSVDRATDIYQLGLVLYTAITGESYYSGAFEEIRQRKVGDQPREIETDILSDSSQTGSTPPDTNRRLALQDEFAPILARATAREKLQRFETATQFHQALRRIE